MSDEQLVGLFRGGDRDSFEVLVGRWEGPLYNLAYRFLGHPEEARDVCQETFLRVYRQAGHFRDGAKFSTWLYQIALNLCRDICRRRRRWEKVVIPAGAIRKGEDSPPVEAPDRSESVEATAIRASERRRVRAALAVLSAEQREVVVMKEFQGLKFREIAEILGCPESTVKSRMYYGLVNLKAALFVPEDGPGVRRQP